MIMKNKKVKTGVVKKKISFRFVYDQMGGDLCEFIVPGSLSSRVFTINL